MYMGDGGTEEPTSTYICFTGRDKFLTMMDKVCDCDQFVYLTLNQHGDYYPQLEDALKCPELRTRNARATSKYNGGTKRSHDHHHYVTNGLSVQLYKMVQGNETMHYYAQWCVPRPGQMSSEKSRA